MQDPDPIAGRITDGGHQLRQRVYFEDTEGSKLAPANEGR